MKEILLANRNPSEAEDLIHVLGRHVNITLISSASELSPGEASYDLVLIDHNFTAHSGIDFLMDLLSWKPLPVLMLTPPSEPQCAIEGLRAGAFNYIVKTKGYLNFLHIAIDDAISKFHEKKQLKKTIAELQRKVRELEGQMGTAKPPLAGKARAPLSAAPSKQAPRKQGKPPSLIEQIISRFKKGDVNLPALPQIGTQFDAMLKKGADIKDIAMLLKQDVAITSKLINVANSALYRGIEQVTRIETAIGKIGLGKTRQYVEIIANRSLYTSSNKRFVALVQKLWEHSLATAWAAEYFSGLLSLNTETDVFSLGLTHDIGKLILIQVIGELDGKGKYGSSMDHDKVLSTLNLYHGRFGAVLLNRWGFPQAFKDTAMFHDDFNQMKDPSSEFLCVHLANLLANKIGYGIGPVPEMELAEADSCLFLGLRPDEIDGACNQTATYMDTIKKAL